MFALFKTKKKNKLFPIIIIVVTLAAIVAAVTIVTSGHTDGRQHTQVTSTLEKILEVNNLGTAKTYYNAVATKRNPEDDNAMYYAAYEGMITAGIDFSKIEIAEDVKTKTITITLPPAEILEYEVNAGTIDYLVYDNKSSETMPTEAYSLCLSDLKKRAEEDTDKLLNAAKENAENAVKGLFEPWLLQSDKEYTLIIQ